MAKGQMPERTYKVLVFGIERKGLTPPSKQIKTHNFSIFFEEFNSPRRFQEYDGVVLFQGIFERFKDAHGGYGETYVSHSYDVDELDKRKKESALLTEKGGFLCFLLTDPIFDTAKYSSNISGTDLAKYHLSFDHFYRKNFTKRMVDLTPAIDEFKRFLQVYGAASSYFEDHNRGLQLRKLATYSGSLTGFILNRSEYFVPSLVPDSREEVITEYFELLVDAVTSVHNKLHQDVPDWVKAFHFSEEASLSQGREKVVTQLRSIDARMEQLTRYKASLVQTDSDLVSTVAEIIEATFGVAVDQTDELREDVKLIDKENKVLAICEIKGINRGVDRAAINQADSHRERSGFDERFPALLIVNPNIKSARSIVDKESHTIAIEQIRHAVQMRILIMRTIDILELLRLVLDGKVTQEKALNLILIGVGWLRVEGDEPVLVVAKA